MSSAGPRDYVDGVSLSYDDLARVMNPEQLRATTTTEGPLLILAGAGSGKTRVLVHRAAHILHERRAQPWEIFMVTFTNKAAREMTERLEKLIGPEVRSAWIGTFHALCARILRREGHRLGYKSHFTIYDTDDSKRLIKKLMGEMDFDSDNYALSPPKIISAIDKAKNLGLSPEKFKASLDQFSGPVERAAMAVYFKYQNALRRANAMDFSDLLLFTVELFKHHIEARMLYARRFRYVMVDEFQDTNQTQYDILRYIVSESGNFAVVGDDDQSIYRWRGAEVTNILGFSKAYPNAAVIKLEQNYRSTANIIAAANSVIRQNTTRHDKTLFTDTEAGAPVGVAVFDYGDQEAYVIARLLRDRIDAGEDPSDFAILYRQNAQSRSFEEHFMRHQVPYLLVGGTGFYQRKEVKDIVAYLRLIANPHSRADFERIINVPSRKIGNTTLARLRQAADTAEVEGTDILGLSDSALDAVGLRGAILQRLRKFSRMLTSLREYAEDAKASEVALKAIKMSEYLAHLDRSDATSADDRKANIDELVSSIVEHEQSYGQAVPNPEEDAEEEFGIAGAKTPLQAFLDQASLGGGEEAGTEGGVNLLTLHSAKGLEYPVVFMVGMEEMTFPSKRVLESGDREALEEERRLCYVGVTRAQKEVNLTAARMRRVYGNEEPRRLSRFLAELPPGVVANLPMNAAQRKAAPTTAPVLPAAHTENRGGDHVEYVDPPNQRAPMETSVASEHPQVGEMVHHNLFGAGCVIARDAPGSKGKLTIQFANERKRVVSKFVQKA